jgi:hypothetical protein
MLPVLLLRWWWWWWWWLVAELQLKNPLGEQELRHRSHFGQGERFCEFL